MPAPAFSSPSSYSAATCARPDLRLGLSSQASSQLSTLSDLTKLADTVHLCAEQAKLDDFLIGEVLGKIGIDLILVDGVLASFEQNPHNAVLLSHAD
jgi:hypothetical protein